MLFVLGSLILLIALLSLLSYRDLKASRRRQAAEQREREQREQRDTEVMFQVVRSMMAEGRPQDAAMFICETQLAKSRSQPKGA